MRSCLARVAVLAGVLAAEPRIASAVELEAGLAGRAGSVGLLSVERDAPVTAFGVGGEATVWLVFERWVVGAGLGWTGLESSESRIEGRAERDVFEFAGWAGVGTRARLTESADLRFVLAVGLAAVEDVSLAPLLPEIARDRDVVSLQLRAGVGAKVVGRMVSTNIQK